MQTKKQVNRRRSFIKGMLAGSAVLAGVFSSARKTCAADRVKPAREDEILYEETNAFKRYYKSLRS